MLVIWLTIAAVLIIAALARFAEGDYPDNGAIHHSGDDDEPPDSDEGRDDVLLAA